jgi:ATP-dependent Clp protease ATP-binding subunit ClpB
VRKQPFRVVLFDEIEKAHRRVLDKFLQILEDGRLTDGQGVTTYFSECVLIFTSNLGIMMPESQSGTKRVAIVQRGEPYQVIEGKVRQAIAEHFTSEIGRPELLNRFGDNIVVFNFISDEAAEQIFDLQLANIARRLMSEQQLALSLTPMARAQLRQICTANLDYGGRGIGNMLESALINPLGRALFDHEQAPGSAVVVSGAVLADGIYTLTIGTPAAEVPS